MRAAVVMMAGLLAAAGAQADPGAQETVALINARFASDPFYFTDGYWITMPSACIVEMIPRGSRFSSARTRRIALQVLDRSAVQRLAVGTREHSTYIGTWVELVGRPEVSSRRKGFPPTPDMNERGFPMDDGTMVSYGIQLRFGRRDSARAVAQAFVHLASLCLDSQ